MIKPAVDVMAQAVPRDRSQVARDLVALTKPRVLLMVLATTLAGYFVALGGPRTSSAWPTCSWEHLPLLLAVLALDRP